LLFVLSALFLFGKARVSVIDGGKGLVFPFCGVVGFFGVLPPFPAVAMAKLLSQIFVFYRF